METEERRIAADRRSYPVPCPSARRATRSPRSRTELMQSRSRRRRSGQGGASAASGGEVELEHDGDFYSLGRTAVYPRPLQQPHPPVWAAAESPATIEWVASQGFGMSTIFLPTKVVGEKLDHYLGLAEEQGGRTGRQTFMLFRNVYVAPTVGGSL